MRSMRALQHSLLVFHARLASALFFTALRWNVRLSGARAPPASGAR
jgi:hypothetical protein